MKVRYLHLDSSRSGAGRGLENWLERSPKCAWGRGGVMKLPKAPKKLKMKSTKGGGILQRSERECGKGRGAHTRSFRHQVDRSGYLLKLGGKRRS